jgi:beta-lactamase regulating signal transducer with metallopeptidase domain
MYESLGICLILAALLTVNAFASLLASACWRIIENPLRVCSARLRAEILFGLRVTPFVVALIFVGAFLLPSYLLYEPYATREVVSMKLGALALVSAAGVAFALWRGVRSWLATRSLLTKWLATAERIRISRVDVPTFRIRHSFPIIAVVGVLRPRLFIAEQVLETLNEVELAAAIAHECGHVAARDNLRRSMLRACCDALLIIPCGRGLDRMWAEASECAADEYAARDSAATALNLASALVRISRMIPSGARALTPVGAFLVGVEESHGVKARVRRLVEMASANQPSNANSTSMVRAIPFASIGIFVLLTLTIGSHLQALAPVHSLVERVVFLLS